MELSRRSPKNSIVYAPEARHVSVPDHNATYIVLFYFFIYVPRKQF
nr:MAG TPA: hypothetical protein [Microviridae sp.]